MKHRSYLCLLAISAAASALLALFADGGNILLATLQFPFAPIAKGLRLLSLSGTVGNLLAWVIYVLLCALPLLPLWLLRRKEKSAKSDLLFVLLIPVLAIALYRLINPTGLLASTEAALPVYRAQYGGTVYAVLLGWPILRTGEALKAADEGALYKAADLFLKLLGVLFVISAFGSSLAALLGDMEALRAANQNSGSLTWSYVFLTLQCLADALPSLLNTVTVCMALTLLDAFVADDDNIADHADRLARWCGTTLVITAAASIGFHVLQLLFQPKLRTTDVSLSFPMGSLAFLAVCLIAARILGENKRLRDDNDLFI
ncbi:MAG: hypothetical protein IJA67_03540 [Oscillospiraceae bacterium]|nr:hypothetical protein [Oscillospiraceae bacterium]